MKNLVKNKSVLIVFLFLSCATILYSQVKVWSDGAVKIGNLNEATHLNGSSLEVAVTKLFIYPTNNLNGAFTIYNNSNFPTIGEGSSATDASSANLPVLVYDKPTYIEPQKAGLLYAGTSAKPLGGVYTQTLTTYNQSITSDSRVKMGISNIVSAMNDVRKLRPVSFDYDIDKIAMPSSLAMNHVGFIAQEVLDVFPHLVKYDSGVNLYSLDYISLIPYLTRALQEQDSLIRGQQEVLQSYAGALAELTEKVSLLEKFVGGLQAHRGAPQVPATGECEGNSGRNELFQNVPNPADRETRIRYRLAEGGGDASVGIYGLDGKEVFMRGLNGLQGEMVVEAGELEPGMYLYSLIVNGQIEDTKRMVVIQ